LNIKFKGSKENLHNIIVNWNENIKYSCFMILPVTITILAAYYFNNYAFLTLNNKNLVFFMENILPIFLAISCFVIILFGGYRFFLKNDHSVRFLILFYVVILSVAVIFYSTSSARDISLLTLFLPFALFFGYIIFCNSRLNLLRPIVYSLIIIITWYTSAKKFEVPYQWFGDEQLNIHQSIYPSKIRLLEGFYLNENKNKYLSEIVSAIVSKSNIDDSIFIFPHYPVLYLISNRYPTTFALFHWIDVASDRVCREDAHRLISTPPELIVYETDTIGIQESLFREFKRSGQRDIIDAIKVMVEQKKYYVLEKIGNFQILKRKDSNTFREVILK
jgi:hypothetical protein